MLARALFAACVLLMSSFTAPPAARAQEITVFAAASLQNALEEIGTVYKQRTGHNAKYSFAASSALARQIEQGAPAAVFASADEQWMDYLQQRKLIVDATRKQLLGNSLVLVVPAGSKAQVDLKPGFDFATVLGSDGRWVTGDPGNVPVGRYAQEALTSLGAWDFAQTRLVRAENVRVALAFVERGEAAAGIVYSTDAALTQKVRVAGTFPASSHKPVTYPFAVVAQHDDPTAREFLAFLEKDEAKAIFRKYGFVVH
ncbi:MAG TPA: molybdate ABC transporter substrate-binding protein [Burkholderiaceae bacterium]|nr:molybdate ABC transporter substrate-binding protein [Burkholderiaceae bacterium]